MVLLIDIYKCIDAEMTGITGKLVDANWPITQLDNEVIATRGYF